MIELVVAMVLLGLALALVVVVVMQAIGASSGARSGGISDSSIARAAARLSDDVVLASTADRRDNLLRDPADLAAALQDNEAAYSSDPSSPSQLLDIEDVVVATPKTLQIRADVDQADGVECVTWRASDASGYELRRLVGATCGTGSIADDVMLRSSNPAAANIDTAPFRYRLLCHRTACAGSQAPPSSPCRPWIVDSVPTHQRRWVIGVIATLGTMTEERSVTSAHANVKAPIRSRDTETYRRGLGC